MSKISLEQIKVLLEKVTGYKIKEIEPIKDELWHLVVRHPYPYKLKGVFDSIHAILQKDGVIVLSKFRTIDFNEDTDIKDIEKILVAEIEEPTKKLLNWRLKEDKKRD